MLRTFKGQRFTTCGGAEKHGLTPLRVDGKGFNPYGNSGAGAVMLAWLSGAEKVILLGYDCQHTGGKAHWHGDHPKKLGNAARPDAWIKNFDRMAEFLSPLPIINASRTTALTCFPRMELEDALCIR